MVTRAAIYCRLSYAPDGSLENVERQESDSRALAERLGWTVSEAHVYRDNSRSAWQRDRKRPGWDRLLEAIQRRDVDGILVYHGDRLIRQPYDLELLIRLTDEYALPLASVSGVRDLSSPDDRHILRIEAAGNCKASDDTSRRVKRAWESRAKAGYPSGGGKRPFAFADLTTPDEREAPILAEAAERVLAGQSLGGVVEWLNTVCTTTQGNRWTSRSLKHLLTAPRIAGLVEHRHTLYEAVWEPVISREHWEDLRGLLERNSQAYPSPGAQPRYLLSNIAADERGHGLRIKPVGGRNRVNKRLYACMVRGCRSVARDQYLLDEYVIGRVLRRLSESTLMDEVAAPVDDGTAAEIVTLERRRAEAREQLENLADHPSVSADVAAKAIESFDRRINELRASRDASTRQRRLARMAGMTRQQWDAEPLDVRRATVRDLFTVTVLPTRQRGPGFDPSAVRVTRV